MIKFTAKGKDGARDLLAIGLSFGNLDHFRAHPRDTFIRISGKDLNLPMDVMIFSGETEAALADMAMQFIGPDTKVSISDKLKQ